MKGVLPVNARPVAAIAGVGEAGIGIHPDRTALQIQAEAAVRAIADAGLEPGDIDGVTATKGGDLLPGDRPALEIAEYLGLCPVFTDSTLAGGASPVIQIQHAVAAIAAGVCETVLITYASTQASRRQRHLGGHAAPEDHLVRQFDGPWGLPMPIGPAALAAARHMHRYGTRPEDLAAVAVSGRQWAMRNPGALRRDPLSVADVLASPYICEPLHRLDICLVTDGAGAVVVRRWDRVPPGRRVSVVGFGEAHSHGSILGAAELTETPAARSGRQAFRMAGCGPRDIDLLQLYDAFTILPIVLLENLGFCASGDGGPLVSSGATGPGGQLPMNTQGGGLSHCHPGIYGIFLVIEAVRQLRGEAGDRQVRAEQALCQASGGGAFGGSQATLILRKG